MDSSEFANDILAKKRECYGAVVDLKKKIISADNEEKVRLRESIVVTVDFLFYFLRLLESTPEIQIDQAKVQIDLTQAKIDLINEKLNTANEDARPILERTRETLEDALVQTKIDLTQAKIDLINEKLSTANEDARPILERKRETLEDALVQTKIDRTQAKIDLINEKLNTANEDKRPILERTRERLEDALVQTNIDRTQAKIDLINEKLSTANEDARSFLERKREILEDSLNHARADLNRLQAQKNSLARTGATESESSQISQLQSQLSELKIESLKQSGLSASGSTIGPKQELESYINSNIFKEDLGSECSMVEHFRLCLKEKLDEIRKCVFPTKTGSEANSVQPDWSSHMMEQQRSSVQQLCRNSGRKLCDTHEQGLGKIKPDGTLIELGKVAGPFTAIGFFEFKGEKTYKEPGSTLQIIKYHANLLYHMQPHRMQCYSLLTNNESISLFHSTRTSDGGILHVKCLEFDFRDIKGKALLYAFLTASLEVHGFNSTSIDTETELVAYLGHGGSCLAFEAAIKRSKTKFVAKFYARTAKLEQELTILQQLNSKGVQNIPEVHKQVGDHWLVVSPLGEPFASNYEKDKPHIKQKHVTQIVMALQQAHAIGICHRDPRRSNFFFVADTDNALLNDWGEAIRFSEEEMEYSGAGSEASLGVLRQLQQNVFGSVLYKPYFDLHVLVHTLIRLIIPGLPIPAFERSESQIGLLIEAWEKIEYPYRKLFDLADKSSPSNAESYVEFTEELCKLLMIHE